MTLAALRSITNHRLFEMASKLKTIGFLTKGSNNYIYLNIDNAFIDDLFPLLDNPGIEIPDYFGDQKAGAHISVIYPEENKIISLEDLHKEYSFRIYDIAQANLGRKAYYILLVDSPELLQLRRKYGLPDLLNFKGFKICFHITIAVKMMKALF